MPTPRITICGLGPGGLGEVSARTVEALASADQCFLRTSQHPSASLAPNAVSFDHLYDVADTFDDVYRAISVQLKEAAATGASVVYAVPGSPLVLERTVRYLRDDPEVDIELIPAVSFLDAIWARLDIDPIESSVRLVDGHTFARDAAGERGPLLVAHTHANWVLSELKLAIDAGPEQKAIILQAVGTPDERVVEVEWPELDRTIEADHLTSVYIETVTAPVAQELQRSVDLMRRLRAECPWDRKQTHESLRRYLIEETYEVIDAIDNLDPDDPETYIDLEEELGDLWFQILFHSELATEAGQFSIADVARTVHDKLVQRHPHVFGDVSVNNADDVVANWEAIKKDEKSRSSVMDGIATSLPALQLAEKVSPRPGGPTPIDADAVTRQLMSIDFNTSDELGVVLLALAVGK
ncbi:MAG: MazG family protein [Acidimicrobiales bacterium]